MKISRSYFFLFLLLFVLATSRKAVADEPSSAIERLNHPAFSVRKKAVAALIRSGKKALPLLVKALKSPHDRVRGNALFILGKLGKDASGAVAAIKKALKDPNPQVRVNAFGALGQIGPAAASAMPELMDYLDKFALFHALKVVDSIGNIGPQAVAHLLTRLKRGKSKQPWWLLLALGKIGPKAAAAVPLLLKFSGDKVDYNRSAAIQALGDIMPSKPSVLARLIKSLDDPRWFVRYYGVVALGKAGKRAKSALPRLRLLMRRSKQEKLRLACKRSIRQILAKRSPLARPEGR